MSDIGTVLAGLITANNVAAILVFALFFRVGWRVTDIMMDALEKWVNNQLGSGDS